MLLDAIVTVLRETLEAGVLISVLASLGARLALPLRWLAWAFGAGLLGALGYALGLRAILSWFDGVGQEVTNAAMQYAIYLLLAGALVAGQRARRALLCCMTAAVALAVTREGAEILLFFSSYLQSEQAFVRALTSGFVGLTIGLSVGVLCYFGLAVMLPPGAADRARHAILPLIAGGMALQATQLLIQADWLPAGLPLWNSGGILSEHSVPGQIAYAVFGYEATPTALEVGVYAAALLLLLGARRLAARREPA